MTMTRAEILEAGMVRAAKICEKRAELYDLEGTDALVGAEAIDCANAILAAIRPHLPEAPAFTEAARTAPERIWLQEDNQEDGTWCTEKIQDGDVEYVRADLAGAQRLSLSELTRLIHNKENHLRVLDEHKVNPGNDKLLVEVMDEPGQGGACHVYRVTTPPPADEQTIIKFQNGPINEDGNGVNGLTHEVLLAIVADRLRSFQKGPYSCNENDCALTHIGEALHWLQQRTLERMRRGVEGTHTV